MKHIRRWLPLTLAITGFVVPLILVIFGIFYGVWVENRTSGDGPNNIVWVGFLALPIFQLGAIISGIFAWRTTEGKLGMLIALVILLCYAGYLLR